MRCCGASRACVTSCSPTWVAGTPVLRQRGSRRGRARSCDCLDERDSAAWAHGPNRSFPSMRTARRFAATPTMTGGDRRSADYRRGRIGGVEAHILETSKSSRPPSALQKSVAPSAITTRAGTLGTLCAVAATAVRHDRAALYMPLRLALTGLVSGPELSDLLPLLGREGTLARRP